MPRAQTDSTTASDTKTKKAPAKRTASRTKAAVSKSASTTRQRTTSRARTTKNPPETPEMTEPVVTVPARKAPTPVAAQAARSRRSKIILGVAAVISVGCVGTGVYVGVSEPGSIDVNTIIQSGNEQISRGEFVDPRTGQTVTRTISTQSDSRRTNSGLRASAPSDTQAPDPEPEIIDETSTTTATTTDEQLPADEIDGTEESIAPDAVQDEVTTESEV